MNLFQPAAEDKLKLYGLFKQAQDPSRSDPCCPAALLRAFARGEGRRQHRLCSMVSPVGDEGEVGSPLA